MSYTKAPPVGNISQAPPSGTTSAAPGSTPIETPASVHPAGTEAVRSKDPPLVDQRFAYNQGIWGIVYGEQNKLQAYLDSLEDPTTEERESIRNEIRELTAWGHEAEYEIESSEWGRNVSIRDSQAAHQLAYGFCRLGGAITFATADEGDSGQWLHIVVTYAGHEIEKVQDLYLDGRQVDFDATVDGNGRRTFGWASTGSDWEYLVFMSALSRGEADQESNSDLLAQAQGPPLALFPTLWTSSHRQRGLAYIYLILKYDAVMFPNGFPDIAIEGYWKNDIYDPRGTPSTGYSDNTALCAANYLMDTKFGPGFPSTAIDMTSLGNAADVCDEVVTTYLGSEDRYVVGGVIEATSSNDHQQVLDTFKRSMGGDIVWNGSQWTFLPGDWVAPTVTLTDEHLRSAVDLVTRPSQTKIFNGVKGRYRSDDTFWELSEYPPIKNDVLYKVQDGGRRYWKELDFPLITSKSRAQRLAKIILEDSRQWITHEAEWSLDAWQLLPGDNVNIESEKFDFDPKIFRVAVCQFQAKQGSNGPYVTIKLLLKEAASGIYDWIWSGDETEIDLAPNTSLPDPSNIRTPTGLTLASGTSHLDRRADGTIFTRIKCTWDTSLDNYVLTGGQHQIQYKKSDDSDWRTAGFCDGTETKFWILDVADLESYDVQIRAEVGTYRSDWHSGDSGEALGYQVIGKTANPETVAGFNAEIRTAGIYLYWNPVSDLDLAHYEIRVGASWSAGTVISIGKVTNFLYKTVASASYTFWIRAADTTGNYSGASASVVVGVADPGAISGLSGLAVYNMVKLNWTAPSAGTFPVDHYKIYKGATFGAASLLGQAAATFKTFQEQTSGNYTYWVTAVDAYGNEGGETSILLKVDAPPFFELLYDEQLNPANAYTLTNTTVENYDIITPVNITETWTEHFRRVQEELILNLDPTLALFSWKGTTEDSQMRVSAWDDQGADGNDFAQSTDANKPVLSRSDNLENLFLYSGDLTNAAWSSSFGTEDDATHFTFTAQNGRIHQTVATVAGESYTFSFNARAVSGNTSLLYRHVDSATGNTTALTVTGTLAAYSVTVLGKTGGGNVDFGIQDANASGFGQIEVTEWQVRHEDADSTYVQSTDYKQHRGIGGLPALVFDGSDDYMASTSLLSDLFAADGKTTFMLIQPNDPGGGAQYLLKDDGANDWLTWISGDSIFVRNNDGSADDSSIAVDNSVQIVELLHDGVDQVIKIGGTSDTDATGSTSDLTDTIEIGADSSPGQYYYNGKIAAIVTFNSQLSSGNQTIVRGALTNLKDSLSLTPQDQIDAGYPIFIQPGVEEAGVYEQHYDYGSAINAALITVIDDPLWVDGDGTISRTLGYSLTEGSWTESAGVTQLYGTNFRWVKVKYDVTPDDDTSIMRMAAPRIRLDVKTETDSVKVQADLTDSGGTTVTWNKTFLDISEDSIQVTYQGTSAYFPSYTISGNTVKVLLWNLTPARVTDYVTVSCEGIVAAG